MQQPEGSQLIDEHERPMQGIFPAAISAETPTDDPNSEPAIVPSTTEVAKAAAQVQDAADQIQQVAADTTNQIQQVAADTANQIQQAVADTASQIEVAQKAAEQVSASAEKLQQTVQAISETASQIQEVQAATTDATPAPTEPPPLTEQEVHAIVEEKIAAALAAPATEEKPEAETDLIAAMGTPAAAQEILQSAMTEKTSRQLIRWPVVFLTASIMLNISLLIVGPLVIRGYVNRLARDNNVSSITNSAPIMDTLSPLLTDNGTNADDQDYNLIVKKQLTGMKNRPLKQKVKKILRESSEVNAIIQGNIDLMKKLKKTEKEAVVESFPMDNVVASVFSELSEEEQAADGAKDIIKSELENISNYAKSNMP